MKGFVADIEKLTEENADSRRVLYTAKHLQLRGCNPSSVASPIRARALRSS